MKSAGTPEGSPIRAILFDCDGVLCPPLRFAAILDSKFGITREVTASFFKTHFVPALLGTEDVANLLPPFLKSWGWPHDIDAFLDLWLASERDVRPELLDLIKTLRQTGYFVGLATNQESRRAKYMRSHMGFGEIFDACFISSELAQMKPEPQYYQKIEEHIGKPAGSILFIDDEQRYLDAAASRGWHTIRYTDFKTMRDELNLLLGRE